MRRISSILFEFVQSFVIAGAIFVITYFFLLRPFQVNGQSMYPTYEDGELIITNIVSLRFQPISRGDVIVFKSPPNQEKDFIKRVIALPGEKILLKDGLIYIDGQAINESSYLDTNLRTYGGSFLRENNETDIPLGNYFVMGDHRNFSSDSREWGFVSYDKIIGKSFIVIWPPQKFKVIKAIKFSNE